MKKLLLSLLCFLSFTAFSQSLSVTPTKSLSVTPADYYYSLASETCTAKFDVVNLTNQEVSVLVSKSENPDDNITSTFCWGITCYPPTTNLSTNPISISAGESSDQFSGYLNNIAAESTFVINYCFELENDPLDKTCVDVTYTSSSVYMGEEEFAPAYNVYPNPAKDVLHIDYSSPLPGDFVLYDMLGNTILKQEVLGPQAINISSFEAGIYFYSFPVSGRDMEVQKLVITH